jgi:hypothetical protein
MADQSIAVERAHGVRPDESVAASGGGGSGGTSGYPGEVHCQTFHIGSDGESICSLSLPSSPNNAGAKEKLSIFAESSSRAPNAAADISRVSAVPEKLGGAAETKTRAPPAENAAGTPWTFSYFFDDEDEGIDAS